MTDRDALFAMDGVRHWRALVVEGERRISDVFCLLFKATTDPPVLQGGK